MLAALLVFAAQGLSVDSRLAKPIAIVEYAKPAPEVCADLSQLTGVAITCDPFLADDLVVLSVRRRPARDVMDKVASVFDWQWLPRNGGYRLAPTDAFRYKATYGREEILRAQGMSLQAAARKGLADLQNSEGATGDSRAAGGVNGALLLGGMMRGGDAVLGIGFAAIASLDPEQALRLWDDRLVVSTRPGPLRLSFSPENSQVTDSALQRFGKLNADELDRRAQGIRPPTIIIGVLISGLDGAYPVRADVELDNWDRAEVNLTDSAGEITTAVFFDLSQQSKKEAHGLDPSIERTLLGTRVAVISSEHVRAGSDLTEPLGLYARWLAIAGSSLGADVISDAFDPYFLSGTPPAFTSTAADLKGLKKAGFTPVLTGNWLINRNPSWARYREEQLPRQFLPAPSPFEDPGTMDERASLYAAITPAQLCSPLCPIDREQYALCRFWNALSPTVRSDLERGRRVPLSEMPSCAIGYLYAAGERADDDLSVWGGAGMNYRTDLFAEPEFVDYAAASQPPAEHRSLAEAKYRHNDFACLYPEDISPTASFRLKSAEVAAVYDIESGRVYDPGEFSDLDGAFKNPVAEAKHLRLAYCRACQLRVDLRPGVHLDREWQVTTFGHEIANDPSTWPKDLRDRIEKHRSLNQTIAALNTPQKTPPR